jgi:hypothetical protein
MPRGLRASGRVGTIRLGSGESERQTLADTTTRGQPGAGAASGTTAGEAPAEDTVAGQQLRGVTTWFARLRRTIRVHWQFSLIVAAAVLMRTIVLAAYPPIMWFNDSFNYVSDAISYIPDQVRANGYPFFLSLALVPWHNVYPVALLQAAMGLAMGVAIYALLRRRGLPWWGAALPAVPVLFDVFELELEHMVTADTLFTFLITIALVICCWRDRPSVTMLAVAGLLVGYATLVRSVGEPLLIVFIVGMLIRLGFFKHSGWRQLLALTVAGVAPIAGYMIWFHGSYGKYALTESQGAFLYSRVSTFAECSKINPPADLKFLCDPTPTYRRPPSQEYLWRNYENWPDSGRETPLMAAYGANNALRFTAKASASMTRFAEQAILAQPGDYLLAVYDDVTHTFGWSRQPDPKDQIGNGNGPEFRFSDAPVGAPWWVEPTASDQTADALNKQLTGVLGHNLAQPAVNHPWAGFVQGYQSAIYLPGTLLGLVVLIGAAGAIGRWRPRPWRSPGGIVLLPWLIGAVLIVFPAASAGFSYRYVIAAVPAACLAAGLAFARPPGERSVRALAADLGRYFGRGVPVKQE